MGRLRVGIALYNDGYYLAAHEPLEERWLEAPPDERSDRLQGLIQASAAVYKSHVGPASGAIGLGESAIAYLRADSCNLDVDALIAWLERLVADPTLGERERPPRIRIDDEAIGLYDLTAPEIVLAASAVAETDDDVLLEQAAEYAEDDIANDEGSPFLALIVDSLTDPRPLVRQRLEEHVRRRRTRNSDVEGLFDDGTE